jgi:hypothetical protein
LLEKLKLAEERVVEQVESNAAAINAEHDATEKLALLSAELQQLQEVCSVPAREECRLSMQTSLTNCLFLLRSMFSFCRRMLS